MFVAISSLMVMMSLVSTVLGAVITAYDDQDLAQYGAGAEEPSYHLETKVQFRNWCEPYSEETCWTQNEETCVLEDYKNCTGVVVTEVERVCFDVTEMLCSLEEIIHYEMVEESYQMIHCD